MYTARLVWSENWTGNLDEAVRRAKDWFPEKHHERIDKAREIVDSGRVLILQNDDAIVESDESTEKEVKTYTIEQGHCTCPDAQYRSPWCKHALARGLVIRARSLNDQANAA